MTANDSSTGGFLLPRALPAPNPLEGQNLLDQLAAMLVGLTGLAGTLVRPRWQPVPVNRPSITIDWIAFGIVGRKSDTFAVQGHETPRLDEIGGGSLDGTPQNLDEGLSLDEDLSLDDPGTLDTPDYDIIQRHEVLELLCSFYGPNADNYASLVREGFAVSQNREALQRLRMGLVGVGDITAVPEPVNAQWYYRVDMPIMIKRLIVRTYPILEILSAEGALLTDQPPLTRNLSVIKT